MACLGKHEQQDTDNLFSDTYL